MTHCGGMNESLNEVTKESLNEGPREKRLKESSKEV